MRTKLGLLLTLLLSGMLLGGCEGNPKIQSVKTFAPAPTVPSVTPPAKQAVEAVQAILPPLAAVQETMLGAGALNWESVKGTALTQLAAVSAAVDKAVVMSHAVSEQAAANDAAVKAVTVRTAAIEGELKVQVANVAALQVDGKKKDVEIASLKSDFRKSTNRVQILLALLAVGLVCLFCYLHRYTMAVVSVIGCGLGIAVLVVMQKAYQIADEHSDAILITLFSILGVSVLWFMVDWLWLRKGDLKAAIRSNPIQDIEDVIARFSSSSAPVSASDAAPAKGGA